MIDPADNPFVPNSPMEEESPVLASVHSILGQVEDLIRRHPVAAAFTTLGLGCAMGLAARELLAPAPTQKQRALELLADIQARLAEFAEPVTGRISDLAEEGVDAVKHSLHAAADSGWGHRFKNLFS